MKLKKARKLIWVTGLCLATVVGFAAAAQPKCSEQFSETTIDSALRVQNMPALESPLQGLPILNSAAHGFPLFSEAAERPVLRSDWDLMNASLGGHREYAIWRVYDADGQVLASTEPIRGSEGQVDGNTAFNAFIDLWNGLGKNPAIRNRAVAVSMTHTHPGFSSDPLLSPISSRFSSGDRAFGKAASRNFKNDPSIAKLRLEMHVLYTKDTSDDGDWDLRKIGYIAKK